MEQNLFTEGVRPGSVTTPEEVHMLICYIFRRPGSRSRWIRPMRCCSASRWSITSSLPRPPSV